MGTFKLLIQDKHYAFFQIPYLHVCKIEFAIMLNKYSLN